jgi:hypothetical protein
LDAERERQTDGLAAAASLNDTDWAVRASCTSETMWKIVHNGTAKVRIRLSGKLPSETRAPSPESTPIALLLVSTPVPIAQNEIREAGDVEKRDLTPPRPAAPHDRHHDERRREADGRVTDAGRPGERTR